MSVDRHTGGQVVKEKRGAKMFNNMKNLFKKDKNKNENLHTEDLMKKLYEQNELLMNQFRQELERR